MGSVEKRLVLVTGGARGIGREVVRALAGSGYATHFTYRAAEADAKALEADLRDKGLSAHAYTCDGSDEATVRAFVDMFVAERGAPYALVNNMGITKDAALVNMSSEQWHSVIRTNLDSVYYFTQRLLRPMMAQGDGVFIQMSSVTGIRGNPGQTNYGATKAAMLGFTQSLAREVGRFNLRANAVLPGFIETDMVAAIPSKQREQIVKNIPLRRMGMAHEVAGMVKFLLSREAAYITGQSFVIDGGLSA